ncbi:hypothetical protein BDV39DRAFT_202181 [Aspergillus sergii]|uniref:Uncharacterized protein n=1 Tax=Aspergillus sergii TaxID=1034303 RepID=A0A5N6XAV9_9EURO|nr:hypothetical protein BDV39DRAFT_202181 [Aspergillus sergii]
MSVALKLAWAVHIVCPAEYLTAALYLSTERGWRNKVEAGMLSYSGLTLIGNSDEDSFKGSFVVPESTTDYQVRSARDVQPPFVTRLEGGSGPEVSATLPNTLCTAASDLQGLLLGLKEIGLDLREMANTARAMVDRLQNLRGDYEQLHFSINTVGDTLSRSVLLIAAQSVSVSAVPSFMATSATERPAAPSEEDVAIDVWVSHLASLDMNSIFWTPSDSSPSKGAVSPPKHRRSNVFNTSSKRAPG